MPRILSQDDVNALLRAICSDKYPHLSEKEDDDVWNALNRELSEPLDEWDSLRKRVLGIASDNKPDKQVLRIGWKCPGCGKCYAPHIDQCNKC
jgi:hypothetical protein